MKIYFASLVVFVTGFLLFMVGAPFQEWEQKLQYQPTTCTAVEILPLSVRWKYGPHNHERVGESSLQMATVGLQLACYFLPSGQPKDFLFEFRYSILQWTISFQFMIGAVLVMTWYPFWKQWRRQAKVRIYQPVMMQ